jgi:hypothetical protein
MTQPLMARIPRAQGGTAARPGSAAGRAGNQISPLRTTPTPNEERSYEP